MRAKGFKSVVGVVLAAALAGALPIAASYSAAAPPNDPSPARGLALAQRVCQGCHVISDEPQPPTPAGIPTFHRIANRPDQSAERITRILISPHRPMPDLHLTREEISDLIAYLDMLRTDPGLPSLMPPGSPDRKPPTPEPS